MTTQPLSAGRAKKIMEAEDPLVPPIDMDEVEEAEKD